MENISTSIMQECHFCGKQVGNELSHKRHLRYCQKQTAQGIAPRQRSCVACVKAKTRCDRKPGADLCTRCKNKKSACILPKMQRPPPGSLPSSSEGSLEGSVHNSPEEVLPDIADFQMYNGNAEPRNKTPYLLENGGFTGDSALLHYSDSDFQNLDGDALSMSLDVLASEIEFPESFFNLTSPLPIPDMLPDLAFGGAKLHEYCAFTLESQSLSTMYFNNPPGASFGIRAEQEWPRTTVDFVCANFAAYPRRILRPETLPPFIHYLHATTEASVAMATALSIAQMRRVRTPEGGMFFWRVVKSEVVRLYQTYINYNEKELLGALQALTIYLLFRVHERGDHPQEVDNILPRAINGVFATIVRGEHLTEAEKNGRRPDFAEWIHMESQRRTVVVLHLIDAVWDIKCDLTLYLTEGGHHMYIESFPLPASRLLWSSKTRQEWEHEYDIELNPDFGYLDLNYADLMVHDNDLRADRGLRLHTGMDEFGQLLVVCTKQKDGSSKSGKIK